MQTSSGVRRTPSSTKYSRLLHSHLLSGPSVQLELSDLDSRRGTSTLDSRRRRQLIGLFECSAQSANVTDPSPSAGSPASPWCVSVRGLSRRRIILTDSLNLQIRQRNFYVLQEHAATAHHWDLRLQLDGGLVSWAIPKGLTGFSKDAGGSGVRAAIETPVHPINDCLLEGGSVGCKKVDDLGSYRLLRTQREEKDRERLQRQDLYDDETTDEEEEQQAEDEKQEDLLARGQSMAFRSFGSTMR